MVNLGSNFVLPLSSKTAEFEVLGIGNIVFGADNLLVDWLVRITLFFISKIFELLKMLWLSNGKHPSAIKVLKKN